LSGAFFLEGAVRLREDGEHFAFALQPQRAKADDDLS
jgi:hypothetical protein